MSLFKRLNALAPSSFSEPVNYKEILFSGLFIFLFLALLQPFGYSNISGVTNKWLIALGYGIITGIILGFYHFSFYQLFKHHIIKLEKYKVWHFILNIFGIILLIGIGNYFFSMFIFTGFKISWHNFITFLIYTMIVGIFPAIFIPFYTYFKLLKKNALASDEINQLTHSQSHDNGTVRITSSAKKEILELGKNQILFFKAQGNYIQVVFLDENKKITKKMIRTTMKSVEENLRNHAEFIRVHRSYIINKTKITKSTGNAQGITLFLDNSDATVPVSRKYISILKNSKK